MNKRIIIVGGGFGGLNVAKALRNCPEIDITLLDRRNHHLFQPLLYQVAMAALSPADIAVPIRAILSGQRNISVLQAEVKQVDLQQQAVITDTDDSYPFDYLVLACGVEDSYFGHEEWEEYAPALKSIEQATEIRRRVLTAFEQAEQSKDPDRQKKMQTFVVIGGGPTGVELAGAIGEMSRYTLTRDFRNIDPGLTRIILVEAGPTILPSFSKPLRRQAVHDLERLGVQVWINSRVSRITAEEVEVGEERIRAATVLWAAGVRAPALNDNLPGEKDRMGRIKVEPDLSLPGYPNIFVIGDQAHALDPQDRPLPGIAPVALQQGRYLGRLLRAELQGKPRKPFRYWDKGQMATIGKSRAVTETHGLRLSGMLAWWAWLVVHIYYLSGFRNRILVLFQWAWSYLTYARGARLIIGKEWRRFSPKR
ncbi:MAG: pyridine nucleotide-disulfide oxidoreductase [Desulfobulbaceae bacterium BRH_c16a]|nr:MAG: pyridine nucleotide-disulfide oxidoreductase [Desulfobulbaceae bacterium BRH_c16a]